MIMRATEFINETINPDILHSEFQHKQKIGEYIYTAKTYITPSGVVTYLLIRCYEKNKLIGTVNFEVRHSGGNKWLESQNTYVMPGYERRGIATTMYAYAKMLGNDVKPSKFQSDMGQDMWKGWRKSGDAKHLTK